MQNVKLSDLNNMLALSLFIGLIFPASCSGDEETKFRLTSRERIQVDTLYNRQIDSLRADLDSFCTQSHDQLLSLAVDSILQERKKTEMELRKRIPKPNN